MDNHDSFVHTLIGYLHELGATTTLVEADAVSDAPAQVSGFDGVLVSPGPGRPEDAGASIAVVTAAVDAGIPLLGVCLVPPALAGSVGATVAKAP
ncbi:anthranilate synthase component II, partial [Rhizobium johnstonii]